MDRFVDLVLRWKPGRTFAQALAAQIASNGLGITDVEWPAALSTSGLAGVAAFVMIWAQGQSWFAEPREAPQE